VEDDDLAEFELPRQIERLKGFSQACVEDTKAIKERITAWQDYAQAIRLACEDEHRLWQLLAYNRGLSTGN
jgi:hypothetical protein